MINLENDWNFYEIYVIVITFTCINIIPRYKRKYQYNCTIIIQLEQEIFQNVHIIVNFRIFNTSIKK